MSTSCRQGRDRDTQAFTLIEALVALAIGGFVIATLTTITGQWLRHWSFGVPVLQRSEMLASSLARVAADLSDARFMAAGPGRPGVMFSGSAGAVTFVRSALPVEAASGLEIIRLAPRPAGDATLIRSRAMLAYGANLTEPTDPAPLVLLRAPYAIRFSYADVSQAWQPNWTIANAMPHYIRVEVIDRRTGRGVLAPEVVALHVTAPMLCAAAGTARRCDAVTGTPSAPGSETVSSSTGTRF